MGQAGKADQFDANFVARAQDFERTAKQDLAQYRTWLEHYAAADQKDRRKHERRLKREQARYGREVRFRYARRLAYRYASATLHFIRTAAVSSWNAVAIFTILVALLAAAAVKWIVVRARAFALLTVRSVQRAIAWTRPRAYRLAVRSRRRAAHTAAWTSAQASHAAAWTGTQSANAFTFAGAQGSQAARWTAARSTKAANWTVTRSAHAASWTAARSAQAAAFTATNLKAGGRETANAAALTSAWLSAKAQDCVRAVPPMMHATRREALRARDFAHAGTLRFRGSAALGFAALGEWARQFVAAGQRAGPVRQPEIALLTFQPPQGALVPIAPACTALVPFEPAPWTGAAERGINITAPEALIDPAPEESPSKRKPPGIKARPRKPRRGPRRKRHQNSDTPGKPRPRGKKRPRAG